MKSFSVTVLCCILLYSDFNINVNSAEVTDSPLEEPVVSSTGISKCMSEKTLGGFVNCATLKALKAVNRASNQLTMELAPGVSIINENSVPLRELRSLNEDQLPENSKQRAFKLLRMLLDETVHFFDGKVLKIQMPRGSGEAIGRALEEGRTKMKKSLSPLVVGIIAKLVTVVPVVLGALSLLSVKAIIVAKIAFVLALFIFLPYFLGGRGIITPYGGFNGLGPNYNTGTWGTNTIGGVGAGQYPYNKRSFAVEKEEAQNLAYSAQKPE